MTQSTSTSLLHGIRNADPAAWARVCSLYGPLIQHWCRLKGVAAADIDDVTQDVLVAVIKYGATFRKERPEDRFRNWLWVVTKHGIVAHGKGLANSRQLTAEELIHSVEAFDDAPPVPEDVRYALLIKASAIVEAAVSQKTWEIFQESIAGNLSNEHIAERFDTTVNNVRVIRFRMLAKIRDALELTQEGDESSDDGEC